MIDSNKNIKNQEVIYNDEISFNILGKQINLLCEEINGIKYTVANFDRYYYHLGNVKPNIHSAVKFYQIYFKVNLYKNIISEIIEKNK